MNQIYIIEHLEPEIWPWCLIEYKSISKIVGKENLWFTNIKPSNESKELSKYGKVIPESVKSLNLQDACVLDPEAPALLSPKECKDFKYFIFGGILGNYPAKKRTKVELTRFLTNVKARNIGKGQFTTDNAVFVVSQIASGKAIQEMKFQDNPKIELNKVESITLHYCYPLINGKPRINKGIIEYIKNKKEF